MLIGADGIPRQPGPADSARLLALWNDSRPCTGLTAEPTE
jgi:poly-gamma-glutamate synthesis protein (capsule biosynthesis protein)